MYKNTFLMFVLFLIPLGLDAENDSIEGFLDYIYVRKQSVVRIESRPDAFIGSGFFINTDGKILTCAHVLKTKNGYLDSVYARNFVQVTLTKTKDSTKIWKEWLLVCDVEHILPRIDMAILQVKKDRYTIERYPWTPLWRKKWLKEGQDIAICAFIPDSFIRPKAFIAKGIISTIRDSVYDTGIGNYIDIIQMDLNISKGTSGGPIFSAENGRVIAMQKAGMFEDSLSSQTPYAIGITMDQFIGVFDSLSISYDAK